MVNGYLWLQQQEIAPADLPMKLAAHLCHELFNVQGLEPARGGVPEWQQRYSRDVDA
jgi:hypothetical protein